MAPQPCRLCSRTVFWTFKMHFAHLVQNWYKMQRIGAYCPEYPFSVLSYHIEQHYRNETILLDTISTFNFHIVSLPWENWCVIIGQTIISWIQWSSNSPFFVSNSILRSSWQNSSERSIVQTDRLERRIFSSGFSNLYKKPLSFQILCKFQLLRNYWRFCPVHIGYICINICSYTFVSLSACVWAIGAYHVFHVDYKLIPAL